MKHLSLFFLFVSSVLLSQQLNAQCNTWINSPTQNEAENAHSIYRQAMKVNDFNIAFEHWNIAYKLAPAADGKRDSHYTDGIELLKQKLEKTTDEAARADIKSQIIKLYDEAIECYKAGVITLQKNNTKEGINEKIGFLYGRKAYDMFYYLNSPYDANLEAIKKSIEYAGDKAEYIIFDPWAHIVVYDFKNNVIQKPEVIEYYKRLSDIASYNIANNEELSEGYQQSKAAMDYTLGEIEGEVFDCQYFKEKLIPEYEESGDPSVLKRVIATLKSQGCDSSDPDIAKLDKEWSKYATEENARLLAEYEANNPAAAAKAAYDAGKYSEAIEKYNTAISEETDKDKKATMLLAVASIEFRKLNLYSRARSTAYEAAKVNPGWGRPYMLIGDMYGHTARSCGDSWTQRLAILAAMDKYSYAKSIDNSVASEANDRLSKYYGSIPEKAEGHMRGVSEGQSVNVGCWIGETVKLRFK
ncbi:MAG: hypothetical protein H6567_00415 [Lewinellaceae bacterium]|nr:hypothetical protein [Lewinellaceae bacterium]